MSDGLFLKACREVAAKYPDITYEEMIVDNTCMQLASRASQFDVMLCPSMCVFFGGGYAVHVELVMLVPLSHVPHTTTTPTDFYGNLVSNIVAGLCGSAGTIPGANIGKDAAVFEQVCVLFRAV